MANSSSWSHGNAFTPETTIGTLQQVDGQAYTDVVGLPTGWGKAFRFAGATRDWFHIGIPTPTYIADRKLYLDRVHLLFTVTGGGGVNKVHCWNSNSRFFMWESLHAEVSMEGDWSSFGTRVPRDRVAFNDQDLTNFWSPRTENGERFFVGLGLGISVRVHAAGSNTLITFHAAGADWNDQIH